MNDLGPVTVCVRQRPINKVEESNEIAIKIDVLNENVLKLNNRTFAFDKIIEPNCSQEQLYISAIQPMAHKFLNGFHCTVLATGQTGTGKSFTMGLQDSSALNAGIIPRVLGEILYLPQNETTPKKMQIFVSFIEIYNEKVFDLLSENNQEPVNVKGHKFVGAKKLKITTLDEGQVVLQNGNKHRHVRPTKMNRNSSRSHAIFTIYGEIQQDSATTVSAFNLVDLAGSEGVRRTSHKGDALTEGVNINQGLLCILKVIKALSEGSKVIPYRDSVLTLVLQDSLNAKAYLTLLACISPLQKDLSETLATLKFACSAKTLKHTPQMNAVIDEYEKSQTAAKPFKIPFPPKSKNFMTPISRKKNFVTSTAVFGSNKKTAIQNLRFSTPSTPTANNFILKNKSRGVSDTPTPNSSSSIKQSKGHNLFGKMENDISKISEHSDANNSMEFSALDVSSSTTFSEKEITTAPHPLPQLKSLQYIQPPPTSFSPMIRRLVSEFTTIVDMKIKPLMDTMTTIRMQQSMVDAPGPKNYTFQFPEETIINNNAISAEVVSNTENVMSAIPLLFPQAIEELRINLGDSPTKKTITKPARKSESNESTLKNVSKLEFALLLNFTNEIADTTINSTCNDNTMTNSTIKMKENVPHTSSLRRSVRLSSRFEPTRSETVISQPRVIRNELSTESNHINVRRSRRLTMLNEEKNLRAQQQLENERVARLSNVLQDKTQQHSNALNTQNSIKPKSSSKTNTVKAFEDAKKATKKGDARMAHRQCVLDILNTGDVKRLQLLATVGPKTANQIYTYRNLNGTFKDLKSLRKLVFFRGKGYERFLGSNNLELELD